MYFNTMYPDDTDGCHMQDILVLFLTFHPRDHPDNNSGFAAVFLNRFVHDKINMNNNDHKTFINKWDTAEVKVKFQLYISSIVSSY